MRILILNIVTFVLCVVSISMYGEEPEYFSGRLRLSLPPTIYVVPGVESNVYFRNIVLTTNPANYAFEASCDKGKQYQDRWTLTAEPDDVGDHPLRIRVWDEENRLVAQCSTVVRIVPQDSGSPEPVTALLIGASLTQASVYPQHLLDLSAKDESLNLRLIGSRGPNNQPADGELRHEGYNGWTAQAFVTLHGPLSRTGVYKRPETGSPFVYEDDAGHRELDFQRYYEQFNGGRAPDFFTIQLGTNDIFRGNDDTIDDTVDEALGYFDRLIENIRETGPDTRVGILMVAPASPSQDGFRNYAGKGKQTAWQYRRNHHRLIEEMTRRFQGRTGENIYLVPVNLNLDTVHGYPTWTAPLNARMSTEVTRVNNGTHPSDDGYRQIGDSIFSWIKSVHAGPSTPESPNATP